MAEQGRTREDNYDEACTTFLKIYEPHHILVPEKNLGARKFPAFISKRIIKMFT
jgi:hypothetical protein